MPNYRVTVILTCCGGKVLERIQTDVRNPDTRQYWGCEPLCDECGCAVDECDREEEEVTV